MKRAWDRLCRCWPGLAWSAARCLCPPRLASFRVCRQLFAHKLLQYIVQYLTKAAKLASTDESRILSQSRLAQLSSVIVCSQQAGALRDELLAGQIAADDVVGGNCIHPACIRASLRQSLVALKLHAVDLLYLHNPAEAQMPPLGREPFLQRLLAAFRELEHLRCRYPLRLLVMLRSRRFWGLKPA